MSDLKPGEVHIWHARVSALAVAMVQLEKPLSESERRRAKAFLREEDRERYHCAHGMLRWILADYAECPANQLAFQEGKFGKPELAGVASSAGLRFNLTHSGDVVALAVARNLDVGIDVESVRSNFDPLELAESQFSKMECEELRALPREEQRLAFFRGWTRKEAFLKARGDGLQFGLAKFAVSLSPSRPPSLRWVENDPVAPSRWTLVDLEIGSGYCAAVAAEALSINVTQREWQPPFKSS